MFKGVTIYKSISIMWYSFRGWYSDVCELWGHVAVGACGLWEIVSCLCCVQFDDLLVIVSVSYHHLIRVQLVSVCPYAVTYLLESEQPGIYNRYIDATSPEVDLVSIECLVVIEWPVLQVQDAATDTLLYDVNEYRAVYRMVYLIW